MTYPISIRFLHMTESQALADTLREKAARLGQFHPALTGCSVTIEQQGLHHQQGREFNVRLDIQLKGKEIAITRAANEDPYIAARDAFDAARRVLDSEIDMRRGFVKA